MAYNHAPHAGFFLGNGMGPVTIRLSMGYHND
ncbi:hypothetical protein [Paenibacillus ihbetae]